jgi:RNA polymerase sigma factor (sigma-70 family)
LPLSRRADRSFEQLYRRHARDVYQYALAVLANPADAEDVTQTTFLNAYRAFQKGERPQKPHNWLIAIAHNVCRMRWRQAGSRPKEVALDEAPEPVAFDVERSDLDGVLTALAQLSFNQRAALVMRELEGRSYQEISEVLGVSVSAVEALLFRARRRLQLKRGSLGVITTVPLPGSLGGLFGGGGGAVAAGGAAFGADLVLKAAAVVAVGGAVAGAGYKSVDAVKANAAAQLPAVSTVAPAGHHQASVKATRAAHRARRAAGKTLRHARPTTASRQAARPGATTASASAPAAQPAAQTSASSPAGTTAAAPPPVVLQTPTVAVKTPPVTVTTPPIAVVPPVTVTVPTLPLPPIPPVTVTVPPLLPPPPPHR